MKTRMMLGVSILLAIVMLGVAAMPCAEAADFRGGDRIVISADQVIDGDLFVAAGEVVVDGTIKGDLYAFANTVTVNGTVELDVLAAAQTIIINGTVGDHARLAGQAIVLGSNAKITRSALIGAFSLETQPTSTIGGDLLFGGYQGLLAGTVEQDVLAGANGLEIRGVVGGNVQASVGDESGGTASTFFMPSPTVAIPIVPVGLTIGPTAKIGGSVAYESFQAAKIASGAQVMGSITQTQPERGGRQRTPEQLQQEQQQATINFWLDQARRFIILLGLGLLVLWILPQWIKSLADAIEQRPLPSFGYGVLMFIGFVVLLIVIVLVGLLLAIVFGLLTLGELTRLTILVGIVTFGVVITAYYIFVAYLAPIIVSYLGGRWIVTRVQPQWAQRRVVAFILGLALLTLLALIPWVNIVVGILVGLAALGALWLWAAPWFSRRPATAMQAP